MYEWKILGITSNDDGLITEARYHVSLEKKKHKVESEGNCFFKEPQLVIPFDQVTEENVIDWIKEETTQDGKNSVELRLNEQLEALASQRDTVVPWGPQIVTPNI